MTTQPEPGFDEIREILIGQRYSRALVRAPGRETVRGLNTIVANRDRPVTWENV